LGGVTRLLWTALIPCAALSQQLAQMPNVLFVYSGSTYPSITSAYSACASAQTCEIWDYGLQTGQSLTSSPWNFDTNELPVHLRLGPGVLTMSGPLIVPRNSTIEGAGRAVGSGAGGTVIQASSGSPPFGGVGYVTVNTATGCSAGSGVFTFTSTVGGSGAAANWSVASLGASLIDPTENPSISE